MHNHMRYISILLLFLLVSCGQKRPSQKEGEAGRASSFYNSEYDEGDDASSIVYVCDGPTAKAYHTDEDCKGLSRCSGDILEMTESEAIEMGRHLCHYCQNGTEPY